MNVILGSRIRSLRETKGFTQEQVADQMSCSRQKYARIEKGLIDISYASLNSIAQIFSISVDEITSSLNKNYKNQPVFRSNSDFLSQDKFEYISDMIDTFYAHRKLYNNVKRVDLNE